MSASIAAVNVTKIPLALRKLDNWVMWRSERKKLRDVKRAKIPYQPNGQCARATDVRTWSTFDTVVDAYAEDGFDGIGLVTAGARIDADRRDPLVLIDLDRVRDPKTGAITPWAAPILEAALTERAYVELSPSATGFHIIGERPQGFTGGGQHRYRLERDRHRIGAETAGCEGSREGGHRIGSRGHPTPPLGNESDATKRP